MAAVLNMMRPKTPGGRLCSPDEIGRLVSFLPADASAYTTDQVRRVNDRPGHVTNPLGLLERRDKFA